MSLRERPHLPSPGGEGRLTCSAAKCETGWGKCSPLERCPSGRSPHPATHFMRVDLPLQGRVSRDRHSHFRFMFQRATHLRNLATRCARALPEISLPPKIEGAGKTGCALHPRSRVRFAQNRCTRAYRAAENTRPSLRNGFTAYAVISPETSSWLTPSLPFSSRLADSLTPATGARTTRFCRTLIHAIVEA